MATEGYAGRTAGDAIENIEFGEFVTSIFSSISETLLHNNFEQMEAYTTLFENVSKGLITYVNETESDISGEEILQYLQNLPPLPEPAESDDTNIEPSTDLVDVLPATVGGVAPVDAVIKLGEKTLDMLNTRLQIPGVTTPPLPQATSSSSSSSEAASPEPVGVDALYSAVAQKIAESRYSVLETMVRMGVVRTVLDEATFGFHFTFNSYEHLRDDYSRVDKFKHKAVNRTKTKDKTGPLFNLFKKHKEKTVSRDKKITINTVKERHLNNRGSNVSIMANINIRMGGESMPLSG